MPLIAPGSTAELFARRILRRAKRFRYSELMPGATAVPLHCF
jgi:hypothetical protein